MKAARPASRSRVPRGLLGMVVLLAAIEGAVARHDRSLATGTDACYRSVARAAATEAPGCEILCFGDSQVKMGVLPAVLAARAGRRAYNLAIVGGQPAASFHAFRRALAAGARPVAVLFNCKANILASNYEWSLAQLSELIDLRGALDLARVARGVGDCAQVGLARVLPSYRHRLALRGCVRAALRGEGEPAWRSVAPLLRNWEANRGAMVNAPNPEYRGSYRAQDVPSLFPDRWEIDRVNAAYIRRFLALARSHGIRVYWLLPPLAPAIQSAREGLGLDEPYLRFVRSVQRRDPSVTVIDGRHSGYEHAVFVDPGHLDRRGAAAFTAALADVLRREATAGRERPSRWVRLPDYRPVEVALEDVEQSRLAVAGAGGEVWR
jgi:hypothetical protein